MVAKKTKSKRMTLQRKYKIKIRTKEHHRKLKKGRMTLGSRKKSNDNFIPNAWPYKEDLLKEIQSAKEKMEAVKLRQREKRGEEIVSLILHCRLYIVLMADFIDEEASWNFSSFKQ